MLAPLRLLDAIVLNVRLEESRPRGTGRRTLHLAGEVAARKHTAVLAEAVRNLIGIDAIERDAHTQSRASNVILDEDELALLGLWNVWEQVPMLVGTCSLMTTSRDHVAGMRCHVRHGASGAASGITLVGVAGENLRLSHVVGATRLAMGWRSLVVVLLVVLSLVVIIRMSIAYCAIHG
jgi:hypothetical protein